MLHPTIIREYRSSTTATAFGREVAVKVLLDRYAPTSGIARRFADEARISGQLQHPNIPAVHDLGSLPDGRPFLAMKLIKGDTLDALLKARTGPADARGRFVAVFEQVCKAVAYAHAHQVIHRDLKPGNVMVGAFGEVQVMDWGLAKVLGARDADPTDPDETVAPTAVRSIRQTDSAFTQAGSVLGTPAYMPPEQAIGAIHKVDARSDVFGLGAILAANVGAFHLCAWAFTMTEAWAWGQAAEHLVGHRSASPWDDAGRRPSHADKRRAWRRELLGNEIRAVLRPGLTEPEIRAAEERLLSLAA